MWLIEAISVLEFFCEKKEVNLEKQKLHKKTNKNHKKPL